MTARRRRPATGTKPAAADTEPAADTTPVAAETEPAAAFAGATLTASLP